MVVSIKYYKLLGYAGGPIDADFLRYYNLNFFAMLEEDVVRTLLLIFHLPVEGALYTEIIGGEFPNETLKLLIQLVHNTDVILWSKTKDAERKRNYPQPPVPE